MLTLLTVGLWLAVITWKLRHRGRAHRAERDAGPRRVEVEVDPGPRRARRVEVEVDPGKCARFAFCEHEAPEIFRLNGDRIDYRMRVPADQIDAVAMAAKVCPARAIKMKVPGAKPYLPQPPVNNDERRPARR